MKTIKLSNGYDFPFIGFGTWQTRGEKLERALEAALKSGYKDIDTAFIYGNELEIGDYFRKNEIDTSELTITSKVWNTEHGYDKTMRAFERSEKELGRVDAYLIHWPGKDTFKETWKALEEIYKAGRVKVIGVSNFRRHHLEELMEDAEIVPMIDQIETNPYMYDADTIEFCKKKGILVQAWSPLAHGGRVFCDPVLTAIAGKHGKSVSQIVLRYLVEQGICPLPKSQTPAYIAENITIDGFSLDEQDKADIAALNVNERCGPDPDEFFGDE